MARGKLPAATVFYDNNARYRRLKGPKGMRFSISVQMPPDDDHKGWWWSKPKRVELSSSDDKGELIRLTDEYRDELQRPSAPPEIVTISDVLTWWTQQRATDERIRQSTRDRERTLLAHLDRYMGNMSLSELTPDDVDHVYVRMRDDGLTQSTRARLHFRLRYILDELVRKRWLPENPVRRVAHAPTMPGRDDDAYEERAVSIEEADALMQQIREEPKDGLHAAVWLAYLCGMRRGECLGLRWSDIETRAVMVAGVKTTRIYIHIRRQMTRRGIAEVKTAASRRTIPIAGIVWDYLDTWRTEQRQMFLKPLPVRDEHGRRTGMKTKAWTPDIHICCNIEGDPWKASGTFNRNLRDFFVEHGLGTWIADDDGRRHYHGATLHALRHTAATAITVNTDLASAQKYLGHSEAITTLRIYNDARDQGLLDAAAHMAQSVATEEDAGVDPIAHEA